ncbi:MAG: hypothetical protein ACLFS4_02820, partial [Opitutales bacterium]
AASVCLGAPDRGINPLATGLGLGMRLRPASAGADALARRGNHPGLASRPPLPTWRIRVNLKHPSRL